MKNTKGLFIKDPNRWRVPRKLKKQIPKDTVYCYTPTSELCFLKEGEYGYTIKLCPFYTRIKFKDMKPLPEWITEKDIEEYGNEDVSWCKLVKCEIDDQCKSCGLKHGKF